MEEVDLLHVYKFQEAIKPYVEFAEKWWKNYEHYTFVQATTIQDVDDAPPGLKLKTNVTGKQSAVPGIQVYPFVHGTTLDMGPCPGGQRKMIQKIVGDGMVMGSITILSKMNIITTAQGALFLALVDTQRMKDAEQTLGRFLYLPNEELLNLAAGICSSELRTRVIKLLTK